MAMCNKSYQLIFSTAICILLSAGTFTGSGNDPNAVPPWPENFTGTYATTSYAANGMVFKPGSGIGDHLQKEDEIYYVLSGRGMMTVDGKEFEVIAGDAVLTRPGSSHALKQVGTQDLVILINYDQAVK